MLAQAAGKEKLALLEQGKDAGVVVWQAGDAHPQPGAARISAGCAAQHFPGRCGASCRRTSARPPSAAATAIYKVAAGHRRRRRRMRRACRRSTSRIGEQLGREMFNAYLASLKAKADVKINQTNLEKK